MSHSYGVDAQTPLLSMWTDLSSANSLWQENNHGHYLIEALIYTTPVVRMDSVWDTTVRKFSRVEVIATGNVYSQVNLYPGHGFALRSKKLSGLGVKQLIRLEEESVASARLRVTLPLNGSYLRYRAQDQSVLSIEWTEGGSYAFYEPSESRVPTDVPAEYSNYYSQRKKIEIAFMPRVRNPKLQDLYIYMVTTESLRDRLFLFFQEPRVYKRVARSALQGAATNAETVLSAQFSDAHFPEVAGGNEPTDNAWFNHLVTPPGSTEPDGGRKLDTGWESYYKTAEKGPWEPSAEAEVASRYSIAPLARIVSAGAAEEVLRFPNASAPDAVSIDHGVSEAGGTLRQDGADYVYVPAKKPPSIINSEPGGTWIPAAYRHSLQQRLPALVDIVQATSGTSSGSSIFVTTFVPPTNFIRFVHHAEGLQLKCCFFNRLQEEDEVPPELIKWHFLAGGGTVSSENVFHPAAQSPVAVLMAEDLRHPDEWRYAVTIIPLPLLSLRDVVRLQEDD